MARFVYVSTDIVATKSSADIDLSRLVSNLDQNASEILAQQKDALVERKDLAQKTKEFRKLEDAEKLTEIKTLLKGVFNLLYVWHHN